MSGAKNTIMARNKEPSVRQLRVGEELRHALAEIFGRGELRDPALRDCAVTVTEVRVSPDLRRATAFVTPLGGASDTSILKALERAASFLQGQLGRQLGLRFTPRLSFEYDNRFDYAAKIDGLLRQPGVSRDLRHGKADDEEPDDGTA